MQASRLSAKDQAGKEEDMSRNANGAGSDRKQGSNEGVTKRQRLPPQIRKLTVADRHTGKTVVRYQ
jgi:hypothetical protein